jgi:hypothetical protein
MLLSKLHTKEDNRVRFGLGLVSEARNMYIQISFVS